MLSFADLEYMKAVEVEAMGSSGTIYRMSLGTSVLGNQDETWAAIGTASCDIWPMSKSEGETVGDNQIIGEAEYFISFPIGTDVILTDVIDSVITYQVTFVPTATWQTNLRVEAKNVNNQILIKG